MARTKSASMISTLDELLANLNKRAEANTEPGSIGGPSDHPTADAEDGTRPASEGARSSENTKDMKEDQGSSGVDSVSPGSGGDQDSVQLNIGLTNKATGEDPSNETGSTKSTKDDPGSANPARTDNSSLNGGKYASELDELKALIKQASTLGNDIVATIAVEASQPAQSKQAAAASSGPASTPAQSAAATPSKPVAKVAEEAGQEGYDIANTTAEPEFDKAAFDRELMSSVADTISYAELMAEKTAAYLDSYFQAVNEKLAEGEEMPPTEEAPPEEGGGGPPPGAGGGDPSGAGGQIDEQALLQLLLQGEGMGAPSPDAMGPQGGGDPGAMGGEEMGGMGGGEMGGGGGEPSPEDLAMLEQILAETGISPEELQAAAAGGGGGGAPPAEEPKVAHWHAKTAADKRKYAAAKSYIEELVGRNRNNKRK